MKDAIQVRMLKDMFDKLEAEAKKEKSSSAEIIRNLIKEHHERSSK